MSAHIEAQQTPPAVRRLEWWDDIRALDPAGQLLLIAVFLIPAVRALLLPDWEGGFGSSFFNFNIPLLEVIFCSLILLGRHTRQYSFSHIPRLAWLAFGIWIIAAIVSSRGAAYPQYATAASLLWGVHFMFAICFSAYIWRQPQFVKLFPLALLGGFMLYLPLFMIGVASIPNPENYRWGWGMPGFLNVRHLDFYLIVILAISNIVLVSKPRTILSRQSLFCYSTIIFCWTLLFWTGARGATLAIAISFLLIAGLLRSNEIGKLLSVNLIAIPIGALLSTIYPVDDGVFGIARFLFQATNAENMNQFTSSRWDLWKEALAVWRQHPFFGAGAAQTKFILPTSWGIFAQPHNVVIQVLMAWGLVGAAPFLGTIGALFYKAYRRLRQRSALSLFQISGLAMALVLFLNAMLDASLYHAFPIFLFITGLLAAAMPSQQADKAKTGPA